MVCYKGWGAEWDEITWKSCQTNDFISYKVIFEFNIDSTSMISRTGLTKHPLDLRGSRRALEAAKIFLEIEDKTEKKSFLDTSMMIGTKSPEPDSSSLVCPTVACQWVTSQFLKLLSLLVSHPNTIPLLFVFFSFLVWLYDCITDMVIIELFWNFKLPIMWGQIRNTYQSSNSILQVSFECKFHRRGGDLPELSNSYNWPVRPPAAARAPLFPDVHPAKLLLLPLVR